LSRIFFGHHVNIAFDCAAVVMIVFFHYYNFSIKKKFALLNPNIYKTANGAAVAGPAIGECRNVLI